VARQNEALRLIEPICTFTQYLDVDAVDKPSLIFRLSDGKQVKDPKKNLENVHMIHLVISSFTELNEPFYHKKR
jgi:hypothetical protein